MITRAVPISDVDVAEFEELGQELLRNGDLRAVKLLTLCLAWGFADDLKFECHIDESAGIAEVVDLEQAWSKRV